MRLSEMNARLRAIRRVRRYKWTAVGMVVVAIAGAAYLVVIGDHIAAWLATAVAPLGLVMSIEWWHETFMRYLEFAGCVGLGVLAAWGAVRSGYPDSAARLFTSACVGGALMLYSSRGL
jgi:hypothetical protein